nr:MAG TPA: hypothetical protein [Bacteriophage sp.]
MPLTSSRSRRASSRLARRRALYTSSDVLFARAIGFDLQNKSGAAWTAPPDIKATRVEG